MLGPINDGIVIVGVSPIAPNCVIRELQYLGLGGGGGVAGVWNYGLCPDGD